METDVLLFTKMKTGVLWGLIMTDVLNDLILIRLL